MDHKDIVFKPLHNVLNNMCKWLLSDGVGAQKKQARVLTRREEETIWDDFCYSTVYSAMAVHPPAVTGIADVTQSL